MSRIVWLTFLGLATACGGPPSALLAPPTFDPKNETKADVVSGTDRPLIVEWPASDRAQLEALTRRGGVVVHYDGRKMSLLPECSTSEPYEYIGVTPKQFVESMATEDELKAKLPLGAASLGAELHKSGKLNVRMTIVGRFEASRDAKKVTQGNCTGATHAVRAITVGAFELFAGGTATVAAGTTVLGAGASGSTRADHHTLSSDGKELACEKATRTDTRPPDGCAAAIRLELARLGEEVKPVDPLVLGEKTLRVVPIKPIASVDVSRADPPWEQLSTTLSAPSKKMLAAYTRDVAAFRAAAQAHAIAQGTPFACLRVKCKEDPAGKARAIAKARATEDRARATLQARVADAAKAVPGERANADEWLLHALLLDADARERGAHLGPTAAAYGRAANAPGNASWTLWTQYYLGHARFDSGDLVGAVEAWRKALAANPNDVVAGELEAQLGSLALDLDNNPDEADKYLLAAEQHWKRNTLGLIARYRRTTALIGRGRFREALAHALALAVDAYKVGANDLYHASLANAARLVAQTGGMSHAPTQLLSDETMLGHLAFLVGEDAIRSDDWYGAQRAWTFLLEKTPHAWEVPRATDRLIELFSQLDDSKRADELVARRATAFSPGSPWFAAQKQTGHNDDEISRATRAGDHLVLREADDTSPRRAALGSIRAVLDTCWGMLGNYDVPLTKIALTIDPVHRGDARVVATITPNSGRAPSAKRCIESMGATTFADSIAPVRATIAAEWADNGQGEWK